VLYLLVKESGAKSWLLRVQVDGRRRDFGLGSASTLSLAEARERAAAIRKTAKAGIDPIEQRRREREERQTIPTFRVAAAQAHAEHKGSWRNAKHRADWLSSLDRYAFQFIGDVRVDRIDGPAVRDLLLPFWLEKPETARRVKQRIGAVLDWAHAKGFRPTEAPTRSIARGLPRQPKKGERHHPAMAYAEVPAFMRKLEDPESIGRLALQFLILTAARCGEIRGATWKEVDLEARTWTVPASRMKAGVTHIVPLSEERWRC
jgi:integrase